MIFLTGFSVAEQEGPSIKDYSFSNFYDDCTTTNSDSSFEPPSKRRKHSASGGLKRERDCNENNMRNEIQTFLREETCQVNPLVWWKTNCHRYPNVSKLAKRFMSAPPSSVESERLFSIGGNIYSAKRNRLTSEHGESLMFLNFNLRAFGFNY